jgi:hypothetical protein
MDSDSTKSSSQKFSEGFSKFKRFYTRTGYTVSAIYEIEDIMETSLSIPIILGFVLVLNYCAYKIGFNSGLKNKHDFAIQEVEKFKAWASQQTACVLNEITSEYQKILLGQMPLSEKTLNDMKLADLYRLEKGLLDLKKAEDDMRLN